MYQTIKPVRLRKMETKETVSLRFTKDLRERMARATLATGLNLSEYAELAIRGQLKRDKIPEL